MVIRPDFSDYVVHFTKEGLPLIKEGEGQLPDDIAKLSSYERVHKILEDKKIVATTMPWTKARAVCFTECTWMSLLDHAERYSPYGIGFHKAFIFAAGGGPAIYLKPDLYQISARICIKFNK